MAFSAAEIREDAAAKLQHTLLLHPHHSLQFFYINNYTIFCTVSQKNYSKCTYAGPTFMPFTTSTENEVIIQENPGPFESKEELPSAAV